MPVFEVVVIGKEYDPETKEKEEVVVVQPLAICAKDKEAAKTRITLAFAKEIAKSETIEVEVLARPFV